MALPARFTKTNNRPSYMVAVFLAILLAYVLVSWIDNWI